ncbi:hypothetical protein JCM21900_005662 [Sporobolomyces salmonicolor]
MPARSPSPPPRRRSPSPPSRRRSRSPPPRSTLDDDRHSSRRHSRYDDDRGDRYGERSGDRDRERDGRGRGGGYDRRGDDYASSRRRSRSPDRRPSGPRVDSGKGREKEGGDGGWGKKGASPGRPSQALPSQQSLLARDGGDGDKTRPKSVEPNFAQSGALAAETNTLRGVVLKYNEPPEARKPVRNWRLYVFKGKEQVELFHVHRQSAYLFGRDRIVADIPVDHPSTSKQHAVLQFRQVVERNEFGDTKSLTKPFLIDLDSANGTMVNDETVPPSRFYELKSGDVLKFAFSTREYVLLVET